MTDRELSTCLAALRLYQECLEGRHQKPQDWEELVGIAEEYPPALTVAEIDELCERINTSKHP